MARPTLDEIFAEPDEFGLLRIEPVRPSAPRHERLTILDEVRVFYQRTGRLPDPDSEAHDEMRLGVIWDRQRAAPSLEMLAADDLGLLGKERQAQTRSWREEVAPEAVPQSLDDIFADDDLDIDQDLNQLEHVTPAALRQQPDHRAEFTPCRDFGTFAPLFAELQAALDAGERQATAVPSRAIIEPLEGDFFIRGGLLAYIAEKGEMSLRGGSRDHRLRVIFSNGTESDPLMSSFRKSLNDDPTSRVVQRSGLGPLDPEFEADRLELSGTIYVARSLSEDPAIAGQRMILHKIGVTSQDVRRRIADARNDPTFLLAPVELVAQYDLQGLSRSKVENLLHRFFAAARPGELFILDRFGKKVHPREWFYVLPEHVAQAAQLIADGRLHLFRYDPSQQAIVPAGESS